VQRKVVVRLIESAKEAGYSDESVGIMLAMVRRESGFNPDAAAGTTSAAGLGQFVEYTGLDFRLNNKNRFDIDANINAIFRIYDVESKEAAIRAGESKEFAAFPKAAQIYALHHEGRSASAKQLLTFLNDEKVDPETMQPVYFNGQSRAGDALVSYAQNAKLLLNKIEFYEHYEDPGDPLQYANQYGPTSNANDVIGGEYQKAKVLQAKLLDSSTSDTTANSSGLTGFFGDLPSGLKSAVNTVSGWLGLESQTYTVQSGDLLSTIAPRYVDANGRPVAWQDIARVNPDIDPNRIAPGQNLKLPPNVRLADGSGTKDNAVGASADGAPPSADNGPLETSNPESQAGFGEVTSRLGNLILDTVLPKAHGADQPPAPYAEDTAPVSGEPAANISAMPPSPFTPLPSYTGDHPTLTIQPGDTIGAIAQSLDMAPGAYSAYLREIYGPNANLNDLLPGRTLPVPPEVVERLPRFNTLTEPEDSAPGSAPAANSADSLTSPPDAPATLGNNFGEGATADPLAPPAYSFNASSTEKAWYSGNNETANSYAQGMQSAISFIQALQQGNELSAALSGMSMLNSLARASGVTQANLPFRQTTTAGLGAVSAGLNLYDALKADDNLGALVAGSNLSAQVAHWVSANAAFEGATRSAAGSFADTMGPVVGVLSIANSLAHGDELGAAIGVIMLVNPVLGIALSVARAFFGGDDPPEPRGTAEVRWGADGSLSVAVTEDDDGGGRSAQGMMQSMLDTLNGYLGRQTDAHGESADATSLSRGPRLDPIGDPLYALIPQRLPTVSFFQREYAEFMLNFTDENGQRVSRHYNGQGQRIGLDGSVESTFAEDFINEVMGQNAIVPKWEADTVRQYQDPGNLSIPRPYICRQSPGQTGCLESFKNPPLPCRTHHPPGNLTAPGIPSRGKERGTAATKHPEVVEEGAERRRARNVKG
jgi:LysM repeat protein